MRKLAIAILIFIFFSILSTTAFSQVIHQGQVVEEKKPVDFHIIPAVGAGIFLEDSQTKSVSNNGFFIVRVPGLILPRFSRWDADRAHQSADRRILDSELRAD